MAKRRLKVVVDTNVLLGSFLSRRKLSSNRKVIRLWLIEKRLRLVLSSGIREEYLKVLEEIAGFDRKRLDRWSARFSDRSRTETVKPTIVVGLSRDPDDNKFIAAAITAKASFLITNDRDLLDIPNSEKRKLKFEIVTPVEFLRRLS